MSYLALARKWRPRSFSELVGQDHITKALIKSLTQQRIHHAYLFTGTRGVGKTSIARLLAKALNCEQGISDTPCLACDTCNAIEQGRFIDLLEIDGASKTRVEDTRELLENIQYAPTTGRYKIYLIDEVHMLSQHSFNALLKTLEEPPAHVKFLLATTDPQKLPITVLSRCLQFNLRHIPASIITKQLVNILTCEQIPFEEEAINILAKAAQGSMRDALSLLDQAIASFTEKLCASEIKTILGYTQKNYAIDLLKTLIELDGTNLIILSRQIEREGGYFIYVLEEIISTLHQLTVYQTLTDHELFDFSTEIKILSTQLTTEDIQLFYQIGIKGLKEIELAPTLLIGFEMIMLRMFTFKPAPLSPLPLLAYEVKNQLEPTSIPLIQEEPIIVDNSCPPHLIDEIKSLPEQVKEILTEPTDDNENWLTILKKINLTGLALNVALNTEWVNKIGREITLKVALGHQSLFNPNVQQRIEQELSLYYNENIKIKINFNDTIQDSPAQKKKLIQTMRQQEAEEIVKNDAVLQRIKEEFSAEVVKDSIEPL